MAIRARNDFFCGHENDPSLDTLDRGQQDYLQPGTNSACARLLLPCAVLQSKSSIVKSTLIPLAVLLLSACMQQATDQESYLPRYTGNELWTINGVRPGMTLDEVRQRHGEPTRSFGKPPTSYSWESTSSSRTLVVTVDMNGHIVEVSGNALMAGDKTILSGSVSEADVKAVLGAGDVSRSVQPGSFVVPTPGKVVGTHHRYRNGNVTFAISLTKEQGLTDVTAQ